MRNAPAATGIRRIGTRAGATVLALAVCLVAACNGDGPATAARPVLVAQPQARGTAFDSFAGDVHAREESTLAFRVGGNLVERRVDVGDRVEAGQVLAVLDGSDYEAQARAARAQLAAAEAELKRARDDQARVRKLGVDKLVSQSAVDAQDAAATAAQGQVDAARANLEVARNQAAYAQLRAPADGVIAARQAEAGQVVAAGQPVFTFAADGAREVAFAVPEVDVDRVRPGQPVQVELWSHPGRRWVGRVREVAPAADPASRTFAARATVDDAGDELELGQSARIHVDGHASGGMAVPLPALLDIDGQASVFVVDPETSTLARRPVVAGDYGQETVEITDGLGATDWVVVAGGHLLQDGQAVSPVDRDNRPVRLRAGAPNDAAGR